MNLKNGEASLPNLVLVGTGIKFLSHLTAEVKNQITHADKILYLVNNPVLEEWICEQNQHAESLQSIYASFERRQEAYQAITQQILQQLSQSTTLCVVLYGHPTIFAQSGLAAVIEAERLGYKTEVLPGISAEDCLFADLRIDPGSCGYQSFDATDFLIYRRAYSIYSHLILWQAHAIGARQHSAHHDNRHGLRILSGYLQQTYPAQHKVVIYEAAQYPMFPPKITKIKLEDLPQLEIPATSLLYLPPAAAMKLDDGMLDKLKHNAI